MYRIIGGDQKEYGPLTPEQVRQWFHEGRLNGQSLILADGASQWVPISALPEFADLVGGAAFGGSPSNLPVSVSLETVLGRDYALDIGDCISRAWNLLKANFWPVVGISLLIYIVIGVINQILGLPTQATTHDLIQNHHATPLEIVLLVITSLIGLPVYTVFTGGLFKYYLKLIRGESATIGDAFSGFNHFGQLALLGLVSGLLTWIGYALCIIPGIYLNIAWVFSIPLVVDRGLSFWEAMAVSRKVVNKHWFMVFALLLVNGLLAMAGIIACCIGVFVTAPLAMVALMYAYEDIFGRPAA